MWLLLSLLLTGWGFIAYSGEIAVAIPQQVKLTFTGQIVNDFNHLTQQVSSQMLTASEEAQIMSELRQITAEVKTMENARYVIEPVLASRGNLYILAASVVGSALFDYLIDYLNNQKDQYFTSLPPASCQTFQVQCGSYHVEHVCGSQCPSVDVAQVVNWVDGGDHNCFYNWSEKEVYLGQNDCVDVDVPDGQTFQCSYSKHYFVKGHDPLDFVDCSSEQPKQRNDYPPFVIPPVSSNDVNNLLPSGDYTNKISFSDSPSIKTPQDLSPPLSSSDGSVIYDIPHYSPDGVFSPDFSNPNNPVPDIPVNNPNIKVSYNITDPTTGKTVSYTDMNNNQVPSSNNNPTDYTYTPTNPDLDSKVDVPEKKDLKSLILSQISIIKSKFSFDNSCSGGACSFNIDVFGHSAVVDFCQFADLFSEIGSIILVFSYFYAFFIVARGN